MKFHFDVQSETHRNEADPARGRLATSVALSIPPLKNVKTQAVNHFTDLVGGLELDACRWIDAERWQIEAGVVKCLESRCFRLLR
jgi:hypothetical protein